MILWSQRVEGLFRFLPYISQSCIYYMTSLQPASLSAPDPSSVMVVCSSGYREAQVRVNPLLESPFHSTVVQLSLLAGLLRYSAV